jgi:hypothetical protein
MTKFTNVNFSKKIQTHPKIYMHIFNGSIFGECQVMVFVAVELQPYGSKNLDGYRRAVVPPIQKT